MATVTEAELAGSYLLQFARCGRDNTYPEVNVNAFRVIVQNKRKLNKNTNEIKR